MPWIELPSDDHYAKITFHPKNESHPGFVLHLNEGARVDIDSHDFQDHLRKKEIPEIPHDARFNALCVTRSKYSDGWSAPGTIDVMPRRRCSHIIAFGGLNRPPELSTDTFYHGRYIPKRAATDEASEGSGVEGEGPESAGEDRTVSTTIRNPLRDEVLRFRFVKRKRETPEESFVIEAGGKSEFQPFKFRNKAKRIDGVDVTFGMYYMDEVNGRLMEDVLIDIRRWYEVYTAELLANGQIGLRHSYRRHYEKGGWVAEAL